MWLESLINPSCCIEMRQALPATLPRRAHCLTEVRGSSTNNGKRHGNCFELSYSHLSKGPGDPYSRKGLYQHLGNICMIHQSASCSKVVVEHFATSDENGSSSNSVIKDGMIVLHFLDIVPLRSWPTHSDRRKSFPGKKSWRNAELLSTSTHPFDGSK